MLEDLLVYNQPLSSIQVISPTSPLLTALTPLRVSFEGGQQRLCPGGHSSGHSRPWRCPRRRPLPLGFCRVDVASVLCRRLGATFETSVEHQAGWGCGRAGWNAWKLAPQRAFIEFLRHHKEPQLGRNSFPPVDHGKSAAKKHDLVKFR